MEGGNTLLILVLDIQLVMVIICQSVENFFLDFFYYSERKHNSKLSILTILCWVQ